MFTSSITECERMWAQRDSNPRPPACKAGALNQLSYAPERTTKLRAFGILSNRKGKVPDVRILYFY